MVFDWLQLEYGQDEETKDKVAIVAILSMTESEIDETIEIVRYLSSCVPRSITRP